MAKSKKLSKSRASGNSFALKSKTLPKSMQRKIEKATEAANEKIRKNNEVYKSSNAHADLYPTK